MLFKRSGWEAKLNKHR